MDYEDCLSGLNKTAQRHFDKIQRLVKYCIYCQPYDGGEYVWVMGEQTDLEDLFDEYNVPEKYRDVIAENLSCGNCGRSQFNRYEEIGLEDHYIEEFYESIRLAEIKYGNKLDIFQDHLVKFPSLALSIPLGKKIHKEIISTSLITAEVSGELFRARVLRDSKVFEAEDLGAPPVGVSGDGRYHHAGQRVLYVAPDQETAIKEVLEYDVKKAIVWVQKYQLAKTDNILDLTASQRNLEEHSSPLMIAILSSRVLKEEVENRQLTWKPQYFIPRFIADCARLAGYSGIKYSSTRSYSENYVFFEPDRLEITAIERPIILIYDRGNNGAYGLDVDF